MVKRMNLLDLGQELVKFLKGAIGLPLEDITHEESGEGFHRDRIILIGNPVNNSRGG